MNGVRADLVSTTPIQSETIIGDHAADKHAVKKRGSKPIGCVLLTGFLSLGLVSAARSTITSHMAHAPTSLPSTTVLILRGLDKMTGRSSEIVAPIGVPVKFATLKITTRYCYSTPPSESPETVAFIQIDDERSDRPPKRVFSGWMYASSPSLNALDHPLYDVWGVSCRSNAPNATSGAVAALAPPAVKPPDSTDREGPMRVPEEAGQ